MGTIFKNVPFISFLHIIDDLTPVSPYPTTVSPPSVLFPGCMARCPLLAIFLAVFDSRKDRVGVPSSLGRWFRGNCMGMLVL